ncbi:MAG: toxin-antitoxin system HicB family antitoxin [Caldilineaceae bacterium]
MTTLTVRLPDSLHKEIKQLAKLDGVSINQFLTLAAAEKVSALRTVEQLRAEAAKGNRDDFATFLAAVPDIEPVQEDQLTADVTLT